MWELLLTIRLSILYLYLCPRKWSFSDLSDGYVNGVYWVGEMRNVSGTISSLYSQIN